jgi:glycosyltransferase involved in cell wall biosynthesis
MDISIIIPAKNEEENLRFLLEDIKNQEWHIKNRKLTYEIIVADANSTDNTRKIAKEYGAKVTKGGLPGVGRNRGALNAKGKIFFMLDADIRIKNKKLFIKSYKEFKRKKLDCAVGRVKPLTKGVKSIWKKGAIRVIYGGSAFLFKLAQKTKHPKGWGAFMIFKSKSFFGVDGFDEKIYFGEDSAMIKKLVEKKFKLGCLSPGLFIETSPRKQLKQGLFKFVWSTFLIDLYKGSKGEITSKKLYHKLTNIEDYFEK